MRLPTPIDVRPAGPSWRLIAAGAAVLGAIAAIAYVATRDDGGSDASDQSGVGVQSANQAPGAIGESSATTASGGSIYSPLASPVALLDGASIVAASPTTMMVRQGGSGDTNLAVLGVELSSPSQPGSMTVVACGTADAQPNVEFAAGRAVVRTVVVPIGESGEVCATSTTDVVASITTLGFLDQQAARPFAKPVIVVDTTAGGLTADHRFESIGVRPEQSTLRVPVTARFGGLDEVGALLVTVAAVDALAGGELRVFAPEVAAPAAAQLEYQAGSTARTTQIVPIGPSGNVCVSTTGSTDVVVEVMALVPSSVVAPTGAASETDAVCAGESFFPGRRVVAMYGTQRSARLGVLGEQTPADAVARLEEIAGPWRAGDRPVLPAFELIATLATGTPEDRGTYNIRSSPEFVQEYLDVARRHGYYLILDLQPGQSDFLTEAMYYDEFLRQPDVGLALDPEWRTQAPQRPKGGFVGQVDAAEVNQVIDYVARLVDEEDLPEKLLIVHQFQDRMITNKAQLVERPGVALTIHMDGFGPRPEKVNSYEIVKVPPPLNMGLKLFFDEDVDLLSADDVLNGGLFDPVPDLITYQ